MPGAVPGGSHAVHPLYITSRYRRRPGAANTEFWRKVPFKMPGSALAPASVAEQVIEAVNAGQQGVLDL